MKEIFYDLGGLNVWLFQAINSQHSAALDDLMLFATSIADHSNFACYAAILSLMALVAIRYTGRRAMLPWFAVLCVFTLGYVVDGWVVGWLKEAFSFPRPLLALPASIVHVVGRPELNLHSFPSGHAFFATLVVASAWPVLNRPGRLLGLAFVLLVAVSRVNLGAHFPVDVLGGVLGSLVVVLFLRRFVSALLHH